MLPESLHHVHVDDQSSVPPVVQFHVTGMQFISVPEGEILIRSDIELDCIGNMELDQTEYHSYIPYFCDSSTYHCYSCPFFAENCCSCLFRFVWVSLCHFCFAENVFPELLIRIVQRHEDIFSNYCKYLRSP